MIFSYILKLLVIGGLVAFATFETIQLVKTIKSRIEKKKSNNLENKE